MNVLIGVLSSNYERYEDQSVGQFYRARVKMLVDLQLRPHTRSSFAVRRWVKFVNRLLEWHRLVQKILLVGPLWNDEAKPRWKSLTKKRLREWQNQSLEWRSVRMLAGTCIFCSKIVFFDFLGIEFLWLCSCERTVWSFSWMSCASAHSVGGQCARQHVTMVAVCVCTCAKD